MLITAGFTSFKYFFFQVIDEFDDTETIVNCGESFSSLTSSGPTLNISIVTDAISTGGGFYITYKPGINANQTNDRSLN